MPYQPATYYRSYYAVSQHLPISGIVCMNGSMLIIGSVIVTSIIGGVFVHGYQNNAGAPSDTTALTEAVSPRIAHADTTVILSPIAATGIASDMTSSTATLHGVVYPHGEEISYRFEYSADPLLGYVLNRRTSHIWLITDSGQTFVEAGVSGLTAHTKYYFRIVAENSTGMLYGDRASFNTK